MARSFFHFLEDAFFLRIQDIQLAISFLISLLEKLSLDRLRVLCNAKTHNVKTDYRGLDPKKSVQL